MKFESNCNAFGTRHAIVDSHCAGMSRNASPRRKKSLDDDDMEIDDDLDDDGAITDIEPEDADWAKKMRERMNREWDERQKRLVRRSFLVKALKIRRKHRKNIVKPHSFELYRGREKLGNEEYFAVELANGVTLPVAESFRMSERERQDGEAPECSIHDIR